MTSRYILDAVERANSVKVRFAPYNDGPLQWHMIVQRRGDGSYGRGFHPEKLRDAADYYFSLCDPASPPLAGTAAACSSSSPPWVG